MAALLEFSLTYGTLKGLYVRVSAHMLSEMNRLGETLAAYHTLERLLFCVDSKMLVEPSFLGERLWAKCANKRSNTGMHSHVLLQATLLREPFGTYRTLVRLCLSVHDAVVFVVLGAIQECLTANATREGKLIGSVKLRRDRIGRVEVPVESFLAHLTAQSSLASFSVLFPVVY